MSDLHTILRRAECLMTAMRTSLGSRVYLEEPRSVENPGDVVANPDTRQLTDSKHSGARENMGRTTDTPAMAGADRDAASSVASDWPAAASLQVLNEGIKNCQRCGLAATRNKFVFGVGNPQADIMVIGEAPGADEDAQGEPFVGRAGQLLNKILEAIDLPREEVYIANIIKCRPPNNRRPASDEVEKCEPYLFKQIDLIKPAFILALGLTSVNTLLKAQHRMGDIRGKTFPFRDTNLIATYHPAALLRNPAWKRQTWEDVQELRRLYDEWKAAQ